MAEDARTAHITTALQEGIDLASGLGHTLGPWHYAGAAIIAVCDRCGALARIGLHEHPIRCDRNAVAFYGPCLPKPEVKESIWSEYRGGY